VLVNVTMGFYYTERAGRLDRSPTTVYELMEKKLIASSDKNK